MGQGAVAGGVFFGGVFAADFAFGAILGGGATQEIVVGGGLAAHEIAGGHTLALHVGQSVAALVTRVALQLNLRLASSFATRALAETILAGMLRAQTSQIAQWLAGTAPRLVLQQSFGTATGYGVLPGATSAFTMFGAQLVLQRDVAAALGYYILTGYPTP
jgi:filamentous hemagglutinin